jgi:hypothetical protein
VKRERWITLRPRDQLGHIGAELTRAALAAPDTDLRRALLERAFELIDLSLDDPRWRPTVLQLLTLRSLVAEAYLGDAPALDRAIAVL